MSGKLDIYNARFMLHYIKSGLRAPLRFRKFQQQKWKTK